MIFFALFGVIINWLAWKKGFYSLSPENRTRFFFLTFKQVSAFFLIFLSCSFFIPAFLSVLPHFKALPNIKSLGWIQAITMSSALLLLFLYAQSLNRQGIKKIWKERGKGIFNDFATGALCWFLTFPLISVLSHLLDLVVQALFELEKYEQVAIRFLKMTVHYLPLLVIALITIVIIAPLVEEFLFRGILQNWLQKHLGRKGAITLSSISFAIFHLAPSQKSGNISLFFSLFVFACFLGFLYEKRRSLFAPIGLHMAYNLMSSIRVIFFEVPT